MKYFSSCLINYLKTLLVRVPKGCRASLLRAKKRRAAGLQAEKNWGFEAP